MAKIAIDVVLLPDQDMQNRAISLSKSLSSKLRLHPTDCVPHISLCMGIIDIDDLPQIEAQIKKAITDVIAQPRTYTLSATQVSTKMIATNELLSGIDIASSQQLTDLQQQIMHLLWKYLSYDVAVFMLTEPASIEPITLDWIKGYTRHHNNPAAFKPHITLGIGTVSDPQLPVSFTASKLAVFELGNYCTCRKKILEFNLH